MATQSNEDFAEFLRLLSDAGVRFVVIGGQAIIFHGRVRATLDLDVLVAPTRANAARIARVVEKFAAPFVAAYDFAKPDTGLRIGPDAGLHIDVTNSIDGVDDFEAVWRRARPGRFLGAEVRFLSAEDMLATKRAANRAKDKADIAFLKRLVGTKTPPRQKKRAKRRR
jgi:predicted nucleotidyltransferase